MTQITVDVSEMIAFANALSAMPQIVDAEMQTAIAESMEEVQFRLQSPPPHPGYPIRWDSEKQRRAFFATNGFGRGIPAERTGQLSNSWQKAMQLTFGGMGLRIIGDVFTNLNYAPYVQELRQQSNIHKGNWTTAQEVVRNVANLINQHFSDAVDRIVARMRG